MKKIIMTIAMGMASYGQAIPRTFDFWGKTAVQEASDTLKEASKAVIDASGGLQESAVRIEGAAVSLQTASENVVKSVDSLGSTLKNVGVSLQKDSTSKVLDLEKLPFMSRIKGWKDNIYSALDTKHTTVAVPVGYFSAAAFLVGSFGLSKIFQKMHAKPSTLGIYNPLAATGVVGAFLLIPDQRYGAACATAYVAYTLKTCFWEKFKKSSKAFLKTWKAETNAAPGTIELRHRDGNGVLAIQAIG